MKRISNLLIFSLIGVLIYSCGNQKFNSAQVQHKLGVLLADSLATKETVALYYNLKKIGNSSTLFGHQNSTAYGVKWKGDNDRSDVKDVTGSHPALYGWDFLSVINKNELISPLELKKLVVEAYNRGGVNTFSWHYNNPVTGNNFYDTTIAVKHILPGGKHHKELTNALDEIANFVLSLKGADGTQIPIIFRPWHEFDGNWFWWGKRFCTEDELKQLYRFTVEYLRDTKNVHNIIYAFSPDRMIYSDEDYFKRYPGDEYVDIMGMDDYWDFNPRGEGLEAITNKLVRLSSLAKKHNKVAAFTETGQESVPDSLWWTTKLLKVLRAKPDSTQIAYVMVWRNANTKHHYAPYIGHKSAADFVEFKNDSTILFQDEVVDLYKIK